MDPGREPGQVQGFFEGRVATAHDRDLLAPEEESIAGRAGAHAAPSQPGLGFDTQPEGRRAGRDDHRVCPVLDSRRPQSEWPRAEVHPLDVHVEDAGAESLGLRAEEAHQLRATDAIGKARVVLDLARRHELAAGLVAAQDDRGQVGACGVDSRGQSRRTGPDDDDMGAFGLAGARRDGLARRKGCATPIWTGVAW